MNKKAQAAMEFLMTYGWAILVVMLVIGALAYFGVLNPEATLPEKCFLPIGINCEEHLMKSGTEGGAKFDLRNGLGNNIEITSFKLFREGQTAPVCVKSNASMVMVINNGEAASIAMPSSATSPAAFDGGNYDPVSNFCDDAELGNPGSKYRYRIEMVYNKEGKEDYDHSIEGELLAKLE